MCVNVCLENALHISCNKLVGYIATLIGVCRPSAGLNVCFCKDYKHEITK